MNKTHIAITLLAVLAMTTGSAWGQATFQDMVKEQGLGWVIGRWTAQTDEGDSIELSYR